MAIPRLRWGSPQLLTQLRDDRLSIGILTACVASLRMTVFTGRRRRRPLHFFVGIFAGWGPVTNFNRSSTKHKVDITIFYRFSTVLCNPKFSTFSTELPTGRAVNDPRELEIHRGLVKIRVFLGKVTKITGGLQKIRQNSSKAEKILLPSRWASTVSTGPSVNS